MPEIHSDQYLVPAPGGRVVTSLKDARAGSLRPGDTLLLRDMSTVAPSHLWSTTPSRGRWRLRLYELSDGQAGRLLMINERDKAGPESPVPPLWELPLDLSGWYAIWFGVPRIELKPLLGPTGIGGVDAALDNDPAFVHVEPQRGTRKGRLMGPVDVEIMCYWKCAPLDGRTLRLQVPYGTFSSFPWGLVRGSLSAIRLVRLSEEQADAYRRDIRDRATKRALVVNDGFSHYWSFARKGTPDIDARFAQQYRDSDVKALIFQGPATGTTHWPSKLAPIAGEDVTPDGWKSLRLGDRRAHDYLRWACDNGQEGFAVLSRLCRSAGLELHASLRMNLFFSATSIFGSAFDALLNGRVWLEHPEYRNPDSTSWDYAHPQVRQFILDLMMEMAGNYDVDGFSMDFTRWPPIADPRRHDFDVLTSFVLEARQRLNEIARRKGRKLQLSAMVVEGDHAYLTLLQQKIDLEAWLKSGALDFVCVQAWDQEPFLAMGSKYNVPHYAIQDVRSIRAPWLQDPEWQQDDRPDEDPVPGEELEDAPHLNTILDPLEYDEIALKGLREGAEGICIVNNFLGWRSTGRLGHTDEMQERLRTGQVWGQEVGPSIRILYDERA